MTYDYDKLYAERPDALGPPSAEIVAFFDRHAGRRLRVLDVGCGQGRDALFIARRGHRVLGIDLAPHGIRDLNRVAQGDNLAAEGIVADIATYRPSGTFDVVLIHRTLHMLTRAARSPVLARLLDHVVGGGWLLIADEPSSIAEFQTVLSGHAGGWSCEYRKRGILFTRRT